MVRWSDMDALGHVNNATYFTYCESARIGYFAAIDRGQFKAYDQEGPALVSATCHFRQQVRYPSVLEVGVRTSKIGSRSLAMEFEIYRKGTEELVADGSCVLAWVDYQIGKAVSLPEELKKAIGAFEATAIK